MEKEKYGVAMQIFLLKKAVFYERHLIFFTVVREQDFNY